MSRLIFVLLSFEGPDLYARAGGLASRVTGLADNLAAVGFETHVFFVGDPTLSGHQPGIGAQPSLHRWCQWISAYHPSGVYDGEEGKHADWTRSLPGWLADNLLAPAVSRGDTVAVLGEEWHTADSVVALAGLVRERGWDRNVHLVWNANNTFGFDRVRWGELKRAAVITTVSRFMKHALWSRGVDARVVPNGIPGSWLQSPNREAHGKLCRMLQDRITVVKIARFDPDKRWDMAVEAVARLRDNGRRPLFLARGGMEAHGREVIARARAQGLRVASAVWSGSGTTALIESLRPHLDADLILLDGHVAEEQLKLLYRSSAAVLANSGIEPFGLVGLEAMASGGIALVGATGEDYVTPGHDAISLQTSDPHEIVHHVTRFASRRSAAGAMRRAARKTATRYTWESVIERLLIPLINEIAGTDFESPWAQQSDARFQNTLRRIRRESARAVAEKTSLPLAS